MQQVYSKQNATAKEAYAAKKAIYDTANGAATSPITATTPAPVRVSYLCGDYSGIDSWNLEKEGQVASQDRPN
jgi:hypothetical protein